MDLSKGCMKTKSKMVKYTVKTEQAMRLIREVKKKIIIIVITIIVITVMITVVDSRFFSLFDKIRNHFFLDCNY